MLPLFMGFSERPAVAIDVRLERWVETGVIEVDLRNRSLGSVCISERLEDVRSVSVHRQGRRVPGDSTVPFIGYRGPSCRTLLPGEIVTIELNAGYWQPNRRSGDRVCYSHSYQSDEVDFEEVTGCAVAR
jgi:hypothetical protein